MKTFKRLYSKSFLAFFMVCMMFILVACTNQSSSVTEDSQTVLEVWLLPFIEPENFEKLINDFNDSHNSIEVELTMLSWSDGREQIKTAISTGNGPDVFYIGAMDDVYINGALVSAKDLGFTDEDLTKFNSLLDGYKVNNEVMAIPLGYEMNMLFYRKDILKEYGFDQPPATWEDMYNTAKTISDATMQNGEPAVMGLQIQGMDEHLNALNLSWGSMFTAAGGQYIKEGESTLNSPEGKEALAYMKSFYDNDIAIPGPSAVNGFTNGSVAMFYFTQPTADQQGWYTDPELKDKWGMAPMPEGPNNAAGHFGGHGIAVNSRSEQIQAAGEFVRWMAAPERTINFMESSHYISPFDIEKLEQDNKAEIEALMSKDSEVWKALNQQLDNNIKAGAAELFIQSRYGYTERWAAQPSYLIPAVTGEIPIDETLENIDIQVNQALQY